MVKQLTTEMIDREAKCLSRRFGFKNVRAVCNYVPRLDEFKLIICADLYFYACVVEGKDLHNSLDNFLEKYIVRGLTEINLSQTQFDDCGQVI